MIESFNERVERSILNIINMFKRNPELFLTESDLKCRLFMELSNDPVFSREEATRDGKKKTTYVHSESSYLVYGKLNKKRVDITVVNPSNYDFENEEFIVRKGYYFEEPSIGIELKLNKNKSKDKMEKELKSLLDDLQQLKISRPESTFYVLVLDKRSVFQIEEISSIQNEYRNIKIFYATVNFTFPRQDHHKRSKIRIISFKSITNFLKNSSKLAKKLRANN